MVISKNGKFYDKWDSLRDSITLFITLGSYLDAVNNEF